MADINETQPANPATSTVSEIPVELKQQMDIALNLGNSQPTESTTELVDTNAGTADVPHETLPQLDFNLLKERFGFEKPDDVLSAIEQYNQIKSNPPATPEPLKFENEFSEKLFSAIKEGKIDEVYSALDQQIRLDKITSGEVNQDNSEEIIKIGMQLEYPTLSKEEINYQYKLQYKLPKQPVRSDDELDGEWEERKAEYDEAVQDVAMRKIIAAKMAMPKLESAKTKISLPDIQKANDPKYEEYLQYMKDLEAEERVDAETIEAYKSFTPKDVLTKVPFIDEANKIAFDFTFEPKQEDFSKVIDLVSNPGKFYDLYKNSDGSSNRKKFLEDVYFSQNREAIIMAAMSQAKNAALKSMLPDNTTGNGLTRQSVQMTQEPNELQKQMDIALGRFMPNGNGNKAVLTQQN